MSVDWGMIIRSHGGHYYVQTDDGVVDCGVRGRLKKQRRPADIVAIGDRVQFTHTEAGAGVIEAVEPRTSALLRRTPPPRPGVRSTRAQIIVANPDQVLVVFAMRNPPLNPLTLDRYLVACEASELPAVIVANKHDLPLDDDDHGLLSLYREIGYQVVTTSAFTGQGIEELRALLKGKLSVLTGPSGVGKSSLLNALWPDLDLKVGAISDYHDKGRHTTVVARLLNPEPDILVADTPGLRVFYFWDIDAEQLEAYFPEFEPFLGECRFQPCTHLHEPGCAIMQAVEDGAIDALRYESYLRMFDIEIEEKEGDW